MAHYKHNFLLIYLLCLVVPFSVDIFIPGVPFMEEYFSGNNISLVFSIFLLAMAIAQPCYGPLSDSFGRKPILLIGLWIYTISSIQIALAENFSLLLIGRFFQGIGACSAVVSVYAIARDVYGKEKMVVVTSKITAIIGISPVLAPLVGVSLLSVYSWQSCFIFLFLMGLIFSLLVQIFLKETMINKSSSSLSFKKIITDYYYLIKINGLLLKCLSSGLVYGIMLGYFNLSSLFIIRQMNFSLTDYGFIFAFTAAAIGIMAIFTPLIVKKFTLSGSINIGLVVVFCGGLLMLICNKESANIYGFIIPMFIVISGAGIVRPSVSAIVMSSSPSTMAGSASALFNFISLTTGSVLVFISSQLVGNIVQFSVFILIVATCATISQIAARS